MGLIKVCLYLNCSQNKSLQVLVLDQNKIGDAGAASISDALAYVQYNHATQNFWFYSLCMQIWHATSPDFFVFLMGPYEHLIVFYRQPKHISNEIVTLEEPNW